MFSLHFGKELHAEVQLRSMCKEVRLAKAMVFPVVMYGCDELDHKES